MQFQSLESGLMRFLEFESLNSDLLSRFLDVESLDSDLMSRFLELESFDSNLLSWIVELTSLDSDPTMMFELLESGRSVSFCSLQESNYLGVCGFCCLSHWILIRR